MTSPPAHYLQAIEELSADPLVRKMAARLPDCPVEQYVNADGSLRYTILRASAEEYILAGGRHQGPVGAIAHAMLRLRAETALTAQPAPASKEPVEVPQEAASVTDDPRGCMSTHGPNCPHDRCDRYGCLLEGDCCQ